MQDTESSRAFPHMVSGPQVSTHSIRCRILKEVGHRATVPVVLRFNPFDPMQDTERPADDDFTVLIVKVSTHSIRCRILKGVNWLTLRYLAASFQPIRSDAGY